MENWRTYFGRAGADIWAIIEQAIILAAVDHPKEFKEKRTDIAETLFSRKLLQLQSVDNDVTRLSGSVITHATNLEEENEVRNDDEDAEHTRGILNMEANRHCLSYDDAQTLNDEIEEENLVMEDLYRIKKTIMHADQSEEVLLDALSELQYLQITVEALKATEIGKQVNNLRKHSSKRVRSLVRQRVRAWKDLVDEWVKNAGDVAVAVLAGSGGCETSAAENTERGSPSPSLDDRALPAARTTSLEMSQLLSFMDDDVGTADVDIEEDHCHSTEPSINDNLYFPSSQSRSMQTNLSDNDCKAYTSHWDGGLSEERGSSSRADCDALGRTEWQPESSSRGSTSQYCKDKKETDYIRLPTSKNIVASSGPGRPVVDTLKMKSNATAVGGRPVNESSKLKRSNGFQSTTEKSISNEMQVSQRLEITKRKLHEGYQQAENAKKQRTVQLVDLPNLPKEGPHQGKPAPLPPSKPGPPKWRW